MELGCEYILTVKILRKKPAVARATPTVHLTSQGLGDLNADLDESSPVDMFTIMDECSHGTFFTRGRGFGWEVWEGLAWPESITSFKSQPGRSFHIPHTIAPRIKPLFTFSDKHLTHLRNKCWTTLIIFLIRFGRQLANCYDARQRLHKIILLISPFRFCIVLQAWSWDTIYSSSPIQPTQ